jgi:hypothetical protein
MRELLGDLLLEQQQPVRSRLQGYAYRRLRQVDPAMRHYQQVLLLNPRHRSAHEHLGETYLVQGDLTKAEEHLIALERICLICDEYDDLKRALATYDKVTKR